MKSDEVMNSFNTLDFKMFDPVEAGEVWAVDFGSNHKVVEISFSYDLGVYLFCCAGCGEPGCWSVTLRVKEDEESVYWYNFEHEHRDWEYNLAYRFEKNAYAQALQKLKNMAARQSL